MATQAPTAPTPTTPPAARMVFDPELIQRPSRELVAALRTMDGQFDGYIKEQLQQIAANDRRLAAQGIEERTQTQRLAALTAAIAAQEPQAEALEAKLAALTQRRDGLLRDIERNQLALDKQAEALLAHDAVAAASREGYDRVQNLVTEARAMTSEARPE